MVPPPFSLSKAEDLRNVFMGRSCSFLLNQTMISAEVYSEIDDLVCWTKQGAQVIKIFQDFASFLLLFQKRNSAPKLQVCYEDPNFK